MSDAPFFDMNDVQPKVEPLGMGPYKANVSRTIEVLVAGKIEEATMEEHRGTFRFWRKGYDDYLLNNVRFWRPIYRPAVKKDVE